MEDSILYLRIYFAGSLPSVLYNISVGGLRAVGDSKRPLNYLIISSIVNVLLDLLFIAVFHWGVAGAALATILSQLLSAVMSFRHMMTTQEIYRIELKQIRIDYESFKETLVLGLPMGLQGCVISLANVVVQSNINFFGKEAMAGNGAYLKVEGFAFLPITCFTMALTTFISQNAGARAYERVKKGMRFGILCSVFTSELTGALIYLLAAPLITLFNSEPEVVAYGISRAQIVTLFYFLLAFTHCMTAILRSLGHSIAPLVIMLVCWCLIRVSYVTITVHILPDIRVVFWAYPITWLLSSLTLIIFYLWKKPVKVPVKEA
jgi:putative MATE family efflux protein